MEHTLEQLDHNFMENQQLAHEVSWLVAYPDIVESLYRLQEALELDSFYEVLLVFICEKDEELASATEIT